MEFDIHTMDTEDSYKLLASVVLPRPIALVTTLEADGRVNAAPFSFFNLLGSTPPVVGLGITNRAPGTPKDTRANIVRSGEFVVNLVTEGLASAMNLCAADFPTGRSELEAAALTAQPSARVSVPRLAESPVNLECRLHSVVESGDNRIVLGEVVFLQIADQFVDSERLRVQADALRLIGRMHGGGWYTRTQDLFELKRPTYAEWVEKG